MSADADQALRDEHAQLKGQLAALTEVQPCQTVHEHPYDFRWCETHDRTFPLDGDCDHRGLSEIDYLTARESQQRVRAIRAEARADKEGTITVPRPHVPFGPAGVPADQADADYLREAARKLEDHYKPFGSNLRVTVVQLVRNAADAIDTNGTTNTSERGRG